MPTNRRSRARKVSRQTERIAALVELARSGTARAKQQAAGQLCNLAMDSHDDQVAIAAEGGIAPLVEMARSGTAVFLG